MNKVVKTGSGEVRESLASGVADEFEMKARVNEKDPYVFRIDFSWFGTATARVLFSRERGAGTSAVLEFAPWPLRKQPPATNPRVWATAALGVAGAGIVLRQFRIMRKRRFGRNSHHGIGRSAAASSLYKGV